MAFEIKMIPSFINSRDKLTLAKKVLLDSKIAFLENTGHLGNCKTFGGGMFEFAVSSDYKIYCIIDNDANIIIFACNLNELAEVKKNKEKNKDLKSWKDLKLENLKDIKYAKSYFNKIMSSYQEIFANSETDSFLMNEFKNILESQGKDNFKNVTGFDYSDLDVSKSMISIKDLQEKLKLMIKIKSINFVSTKSGISEKSIQSILKIKESFDLKDINGLVRYFSRASI